MLIPAAYFCDISGAVDDESVVSTIKHPMTENVVIFADSRCRIFSDQSWLDSDGVLLLTEPLLKTEVISPKVWDFLKANCNLASIDALGHPGLKSRFESYIAGAGLTLPEIMHAFDMYVAVHFDAFGQLVGEPDKKKIARERSLLAGPLASYVHDPQANHRADVIRAVDLRLRHGVSKTSIVDELHQLSVMMIRKRLEGSTSGSAKLDLSLWATLVMAWTLSLQGAAGEAAGEGARSDTFVATVEQMLRDYHNRCQLTGRDRIAGLWSLLDDARTAFFQDDEGEGEPSLWHCLVDLLGEDEAYEPRWITRLRVGLNAWRIPVVTHAENRIDPTPAKMAQSFDDIIGHRVIANAIKSRFARGEHPPLCLHGPDGVGKETLALVYAKAFLCESRSKQSHIACGRCSACKAVDRGSFDLIRLDGRAKEGDPGNIRAWLRLMKFRSQGNGRVVIIQNAERAAELIDTLLKTIERSAKDTLFIICARDLSGLSVTGVSRCEVHRLAPLGYEDATKLASRFCQQKRMTDPDVLELLLEKGCGLPGTLAQASAAIAGENAFAVEDATKALDRDWIPDAIADWASMLQSEAPHTRGYLSLLQKTNPRLVLERIRAVLFHLADRNLDSTRRSPSWRPHVTGLQCLMHLLRDRATTQEKSYPELWSALADFWGQDHSDFTGINNAMEETLLIVRAQPAGEA
ncbi:hypothetical protein [Mesorhizobium sp. 128a]